MACTLIGSQPLDCRDAVGGIKEVKLKKHPGLRTITTDFTSTSGIVTIAAGSRSGWYTWAVEKETGSLTSTVQNNIQNGTSFFNQVVTLVLNKWTAAKRNEVNVLRQMPLLIAIRDFNNNYWLVGMNHGADLTEGSGATGAARGDRSGYTLTFTAAEEEDVQNMSAATYDLLVT